MTYGSSYPGQPQPQPQQPDHQQWAQPGPPASAPETPPGVDGPAATTPAPPQFPQQRQPAPVPPRPPVPGNYPPPAYPYPPTGFGTPPPAPSYGPPTMTPRQPRSQMRAAVMSVVLLLLVCVSIVTGAVISGTPTAAELTAPQVEVLPSPQPGDPPNVRTKYLKQQAGFALNDAANALLDNDKDAWLSHFDTSIHEKMELQFDSLQELQVSNFEYTVLSTPADLSDTVFGLRVAANYCLGGNESHDCQASSIIFESTWSDTAPDFTILTVEDSHEVGPRPWEVDKLKARIGERVIVAAPSKYESRLDDALEVAEAAAENADEWAVYKPVEKYLVYLAGGEEFQRWYGINDPMDNVIGFAIPVPVIDDNNAQRRGGSEVVMHVDRIRDSEEFTSTMRHELGHVATLHHASGTAVQDEEWWLAEGSAELIDHGLDTPIDHYLRKRDVTEYVEKDLWREDFIPPTSTDDVLAGSAKYGIAFYGAYYLSTEYGKEKFLDFLGLVAREGKTADQSSQDVFGKPYSDIENEMVTFVKETVG